MKPIIKYAANQLAGLGIATVCTLCGIVEVVLKTFSAIESVNNMITFDTHIRTHDTYFYTEQNFLTPLDN